MKKLIPLFVLLLMSCQSSTAPEDTPEYNYTVEDCFPLAIGNKWNWINKTHLELDTFMLYEIKIDSSYIWDGKTVYETITGYLIRTRQVIEWSPYYNYYDGGIYEWEYEKPSNDGSYLLRIKEPLEVGNEWGKSREDDDQRLEITEVGISRSVEAGNFDDCIKIELVGSDQYWIYAPDVGLIETNTKELWDYEVK